MKKTTLKSIGAVFAGFVFIGITHTSIDTIFESAGVLPKGNLYTSTPVILFVIFYRAVFSVFGCYITAWAAPAKPMKHALALGILGMVLSMIGAIVTADMDLGPAWYAWSLVVIALPMAWFGGRLYLMRETSKNRVA